MKSPALCSAAQAHLMMPKGAGFPVLSLRVQLWVVSLHYNHGGCLQVLMGNGGAVAVLQSLLQSATAKLEQLNRPKPVCKSARLPRSRKALQQHFEEQRDRCTLCSLCLPPSPPSPPPHPPPYPQYTSPSPSTPKTPSPFPVWKSYPGMGCLHLCMF